MSDSLEEPQPSNESGDDAEPGMVPPATFSALVQMFSTQALVCLGLIPLPDGQVRRQLVTAKHFIDLLGILEEKTRRNLTGHEANLLQLTLHELRLAYVEVSKAPLPPGEA